MDYSKEKAMELLEKYNVSEKRIKHCIGVARVARFLAERLVEKGIDIDPEKMFFAGLVHDIGYSKASYRWEEDAHIEYGDEILKKEGYEEISEIVLRHGVKKYFDGLAPRTWEEKIVNYSDKIYKSKIISLDEWEKRLLSYFPINEVFVRKVYHKLREIENEIFDKIGITFEEMVSELKDCQ